MGLLCWFVLLDVVAGFASFVVNFVVLLCGYVLLYGALLRVGELIWFAG